QTLAEGQGRALDCALGRFREHGGWLHAGVAEAIAKPLRAGASRTRPSAEADPGTSLRQTPRCPRPRDKGGALPELRKDPVTGRWVIIATDRAKRPSDFVRERVQIRGSGFCPFCYGNEGKTPPEVLAYRSNGNGKDSPGWEIRVVPNKFPALGIEGLLNRQG